MSEPIVEPRIARMIAVPAPKTWTQVVFVCSKCMKRQDRRELRSDLKHALKSVGRRDVRIVASGCFDLCPRRGVTIARGRDLGAVARLHVLDNGHSADVAVRWMIDAE
jgi:hypothetical protein